MTDTPDWVHLARWLRRQGYDPPPKHTLINLIQPESPVEPAEPASDSPSEPASEPPEPPISEGYDLDPREQAVLAALRELDHPSRNQLAKHTAATRNGVSGRSVPSLKRVVSGLETRGVVGDDGYGLVVQSR